MRLKSHLFGLLIVALALIAAPLAAQEATTGSVEGMVTDNQNAPLPGVTVELMSTQGTKVTTTDGNGNFRYQFLTPGTYEMRASMQGFNTVERKNVDVRLGSRVRVEVTLSPGVKETIEVVGSAPTVNLTSTTTGASISSDLMESVPVGRTFADTLALAPGVVDSGIDSSNPSIGGASGLENSYVVDGVSINNTGYGSAGSYSIVFGSLGTGVNFDYIQEVQVKTGGYEPEFGEALGGFVNLITKSGGNEVKGSGYGYTQPSALEGEREEFTLVNANVSNADDELTESDIGFEVGGPLKQDTAFWYGSFNPTFQKLNSSTYQAVTDFWNVDRTLERKRKIWNYAGNMKVLANPRHTFGFNAFGDPSKGDMGAQRTKPIAHIGDPEQAFSEIEYGGHNATGRWNGELLSNWFGEASVSMHKDKFDETPLHPELPGGVDQRVPDRFRNPNGQVGGLGFLGASDSKNTQFKLKLSNFFQGGGEHNLRYGIDYQDISFSNLTTYTGTPGHVLRLTSGDAVSTTGFSYQLRPTSFRVTRIRSNDDLQVDTDASYWSFYAYDSWNVTDYLNVMAGIRYEEDKLTGTLTDFKWSGNWAPRFHATVDPTRDNKTKLSFSWGRFFGKIPNDLAVRALSTEVTHLLIYSPASVDLTDVHNPRFTGVTPTFDTTFGNAPTVVCGQSDIPGLTNAEVNELCGGSEAKLTMQDEWTLGAEREVMPFFNLGVTYMNRRLKRTMEDFANASYGGILAGTEDFGSYIIGNPDIAQPNLHPKPVRKYDAFTFHAQKRLHDRWQMLASYTWSKLRGNYEGYFRRDNGQSDPFITSLYDFPYLVDTDVWANTSDPDGILPNDRKHVFNLYGSYMFTNDLNLGMGLKVQSGLPITPLGYNEVYATPGEIALAPRGSLGRGDTATIFDIHADYPIKLGSSGTKLYLMADLFNLFNRQSGLDYLNNAELGCANVPGTAIGTGDCADHDLGKIIQFQDPRQIRVAARLRF